MPRWYDKTLPVLLLVLLGSVLYLPRFLERGWIPHDEGTLAHSAERVLAGQVPHRDFDEVYTGGLSYLYAASFELFGIRLTAIRWVLFGFTLAFVAALYGITLRFLPPTLAGLVTAFGLVWSVPNYFAGVPSWYNLFFATFGTLALLRHLETSRSGWLVAAGLCGGVSVLAKIAGLYFVAAGVLFLVYREQWMSRALEPAGAAARTPAFQLGKGLLALAFSGALARTFAARGLAMDAVLFVAPGATLAAFLVWSEVRDGRGAAAARLGVLIRLLGPFALGVAAPLLLFLIPYLQSHAVGDLVRGLFVLPARRVESAGMAPPPLFTLAASLPYAALLLVPALSSRLERILAALLALALAAVVVNAGSDPAIYLGVWYGLRPLTPLVALAACVTLAQRGAPVGFGAVERQAVFLLAAVASLVSLVQFPYAFGIYFCYAAPLIAVAIVAIVRARRTPPLLHGTVLVFYFAFALWWMNTGFIQAIGLRYIADGQITRLDLPRASLFVYQDRKQQYERIDALVREHAASDYIYAAPDAPEVYFLTAKRNPTRTIFDIFDDPDGRTARILHAIDANGVTVAVINQHPEFSPAALDPELAAGLVTRFPYGEMVGRFQVRWRK